MGRHVKKEPRSPWTWPLIAFAGLVVVVTAGTVVAVIFA